MKTLLFISFFITAAVFMACNNSATTDENGTNSDSAVSATPKIVLQITKQFVTNAEGVVTEVPANAEVGYNEQEISVTFKDSTEKSFTMKVETMDKKVEGIHFKTKDRKYPEVFISSGAQPQVTFSSDRGGNMTLM